MLRTTRLVILVGVLVAVVLIGFAFFVVSSQSTVPSSVPGSDGYATREACEMATHQVCDAVLCDYIPEGMTYEEVCGEGFSPYWLPTSNQPEAF